jgi:hypothetical protein
MRMPYFTAEASLGAARGFYRTARVALTRTASSMVIPAFYSKWLNLEIIDHGGDCVSFCDAFGCIWCCHGICDPEYH